MSSFLPFKSSRDRVERAKQHHNALAEMWNVLAESEFYESFVNVKNNGAGTIRCVPKDGIIPDGFATQLGELLYQLRAALDNLVYDAAILDTGKNPPPNPRDLEFPICNRPEAFTKYASKIAPLSQQRRSLIEAVQPYNTPEIPLDLMFMNFNRTLGILGDWSRKDRHRRLNVLQCWTVKATPQLRLPRGVTLRSMKVRGPGFLKDKDEVASFRLSGYRPGMKVQANPDFLFDIAVEDGPAPCHETDTLGHRMESMIQAVEFVAFMIEKNYPPVFEDAPESRVSI